MIDDRVASAISHWGPRFTTNGVTVADFQRIVSQGISGELLKWKGIEATLKVAESQNAKVVIVGAGKEGLPVILGQ